MKIKLMLRSKLSWECILTNKLNVVFKKIDLKDAGLEDSL